MHHLFESLSAALHKSDLWAAIIGAVIGGAIATFAQLLTIREARRQRENEVRERKSGIATSLLFKLIRIHSTFNNVTEYLVHATETEPKGRSLEGEPWMFFRPLASFPDPVNFAPDEMGLLLSVSGPVLFQKCVALDDIHNGFIGSIRTLCQLRTALTDQLDPDGVAGDVSYGFLSVTPKLRQQMNALNTLIVHLKTSGASDRERSWSAVEGAVIAFKKLGLKIEVERAPKPIADLVG